MQPQHRKRPVEPGSGYSCDASQQQVSKASAIACHATSPLEQHHGRFTQGNRPQGNQVGLVINIRPEQRSS